MFDGFLFILSMSAVISMRVCINMYNRNITMYCVYINIFCLSPNNVRCPYHIL